jgi:hypothetical protein
LPNQWCEPTLVTEEVFEPQVFVKPEPPEMPCCRTVGAPKDSSPAAGHLRGRTVYRNFDWHPAGIHRIKGIDSILEIHQIGPIMSILLKNLTQKFRIMIS